MFSAIFSGRLGELLAPRPNNKKEIWRLLKSGMFDKALKILVDTKGQFDVNDVDPQTGMSPLHFAAAAGKLDLLAELLFQGADVCAVDQSQHSALHFAALNGQKATIEILLRSGCNPSQPNAEGQLPVDLTTDSLCRELLTRDVCNIFSPVAQARVLYEDMMKLKLEESKGTAQPADAPPTSSSEQPAAGGSGKLAMNLNEDFDEAPQFQEVGVLSAKKTKKIQQMMQQGTPAPTPSKKLTFEEAGNTEISASDSPPHTPLSLAPPPTHTTPFAQPGVPSFLTPPPAHPPTTPYLPPLTPSIDRGLFSPGLQSGLGGLGGLASGIGASDWEDVLVQVLAGARETASLPYLCAEERQARYDLMRICTDTTKSQVKLDKAARMLLQDPTLPVRRLNQLGNYGEDGQTPLHIAAGFGNLQLLRLFLEGQEPGEDKYQPPLPEITPWVRDLQGRTPLHIAAAKGQAEVCAYLRQQMKAWPGTVGMGGVGVDPVGQHAPADLAGSTPLGLAKAASRGKGVAEGVVDALYVRGDRNILPASPLPPRVGRVAYAPMTPSSRALVATPSPATPAPTPVPVIVAPAPALLFACSEAHGWSVGMEDRHVLLCPLPVRPAWSVFAVLDGHGGSLSAQLLQDMLLPTLTCMLQGGGELSSSGIHPPVVVGQDYALGVEEESKATPVFLTDLLTDLCLLMDTYLSRHPKLRMKYNAKGEASPAPLDASGAAGVIALLSSDFLCVANVGDCRAVLGMGAEVGGEDTPAADDDAEPKHLVAMPLSRDHKPGLAEERARIERAGGKVQAIGQDESLGFEIVVEKVPQRLRVSRAWGDFYFKKGWGGDGAGSINPADLVVTPLPEVRVVPRGGRELFLLLACDGVWDVMTSQEAVDFVGQGLGFNGPPPYAEPTLPQIGQCLDDLLALCIEKGSKDNLTAVCVVFSDPQLVSRRRGSGGTMVGELPAHYPPMHHTSQSPPYSSPHAPYAHNPHGNTNTVGSAPRRRSSPRINPPPMSTEIDLPPSPPPSHPTLHGVFESEAEGMSPINTSARERK